MFHRPESVSCAGPVREAVERGQPVVALESTVFSALGLPAPHNREAFDRCRVAIEAEGAVVALTAVLDGMPLVGVTDDELDRVLAARVKLSARDLPVAVAGRLDAGVTTVAASLMLAAAAGIGVFATGGIGGVHRGAADTGDISADLGALARYPVVCVSAGAKAFLDLGRTLEHLDTLGVPVLGWQTDTFPAFYSSDSGLAVPHRVDRPEEVAAVALAARDLGWRGGVLVAAPIPEAAEIPRSEIEPAVESALADAAGRNISGAALTPHVLDALARITAGRSVPANLALVEHNARVAARIAVAASS